MSTDIIIINRGQGHSTVYGVHVKTTEAITESIRKLKEGKAKVVVDNDTTLAYKIEQP